MPSLVDTLGAASTSLNTYESAISVVSNNTTNAATPGYATQNPIFVADFFSPSSGGGGVSPGTPQSTRDPYAELTVQQAQSAATYASTLSGSLSNVESIFPLPTAGQSTSGGVAGMMNAFFATFSSLTTNPNDTAARQAVINAAQNLTTAFNETDIQLSASRQNAISNAESNVASINSLVSQIQQINVDKQRNASANSDPGVDAQLHADLENLSQLANITTMTASDGTTSIYLGGQTPLLMGRQQFSLSTGQSSGQLQVLDPNGHDVSALITGGKLGAELQLANTNIPSYEQQLDTMAKSIADAVNQQLANGVDQSGTTPGAALFTYNASAPAHTLSVTAIQPSQIAAASAANPGGNDNAVTLSTMGTSPQASLGGFSFVSYYGNLSARIGTDSQNAQNQSATSQSILTQAQTMRSNVSGVSLDQEATLLTQYQQAFAAVGKLVNVVDQMMQDLLTIVPQY